MTAADISQNGRDVFDADLPTLSYEQLPSSTAAHAAIGAAHRQAPIAIGAHGPEILDYNLVRAVLRDDRFRVPEGLFLANQGITSGPLWDRAVTNLLSLNGPEHNRLRKLVARAFTPKSATRLRTTCVEVITDLLARTENGRCDMVADIARQYPIPIICALLGAPREDWGLFSAWADDIFKMFSWNLADQAPVVERAWDELDDYVDAMVRRRTDALTDDLLSDLIRAECDGDRLTRAELLMLAGGILIAGTDTTRNQLAAAVQALCEHPEQWSLLATHPDLAANAVEELMRHTPVVFSTIRETVQDVELAGYTIPAGTFVVANTAAANRDPAIYPDPDRLDITREGPPAMLTFGGGMHYCLGAHLARLELMEALVAITQAMPDAHIAGAVPWRPLSGISGPAALPMEFALAG
jgi:cytochrome P450